MARQSYLAAEVMWGHKFAPIIFHPVPNGNRYRIDFSEWVLCMTSLHDQLRSGLPHVSDTAAPPALQIPQHVSPARL